MLSPWAHDDVGVVEVRTMTFLLDQAKKRIRFPGEVRVFEDLSPVTLQREITVEMKRLMAYLPGTVVRVPASWWDHVKERWFPVWAKRRWPVEYRSFEPRAYLPELEVEHLRKQGHTLQMSFVPVLR